jgi:hypothetical protein
VLYSGVEPDPVFSIIKGARLKAHGARKKIIRESGRIRGIDI